MPSLVAVASVVNTRHHLSHCPSADAARTGYDLKNLRLTLGKSQISAKAPAGVAAVRLPARGCRVRGERGDGRSVQSRRGVSTHQRRRTATESRLPLCLRYDILTN
ncbi:protein of unknown function [Burkholderia multivorans]